MKIITLLKDKYGQGLVEYALIISLVILVVIYISQIFGTEVLTYYNNNNTEIKAIIPK